MGASTFDRFYKKSNISFRSPYVYKHFLFFFFVLLYISGIVSA